MKDSIIAATRKTAKGSFIFATMGIAVGTDTSINRFVLDKLAPNHALIIQAYWGHVSYFNSASIKAMGLSETEPDVNGGRFGRIANTQRLNGRANEYACNYLRKKFPTTPQLFVQSLKDLSRTAAYFGVTSIQNMCTGASPETFLQYLKQAPLAIRFRLIKWAELDRNKNIFIPAKNRKQSDLPLVDLSGTKWMLDGTPIERNAEWTVAYKDAEP